MPDRVMPSRLELRLESEISTAPSEIEADCKRAELAAYRARLGRIDAARAELAALRGKYAGRPSVRVSAWLHFAEGVGDYFYKDGVVATDGVQRAYALSVASEMNELHALSAAWLAQWAYSRMEVRSLDKYSREALLVADHGNHGARSRACLVVAQALHLALRFDLAKDWYRRSREHAVAEGDSVSIVAHMHNMTWLRMLATRQSVLAGRGTANVERETFANAESNENYEMLIGETSWRKLGPLLRAQILSLRGDTVKALSLYRRYLKDVEVPSPWQANLLSDKAWCYAENFQMDEARQCAELAIANLSENTQIDDRAATYSRLSQVEFLLGNLKRSREYRESAERCWSRFIEIQVEIMDLLANWHFPASN